MLSDSFIITISFWQSFTIYWFISYSRAMECLVADGFFYGKFTSFVVIYSSKYHAIDAHATHETPTISLFWQLKCAHSQ